MCSVFLAHRAASQTLPAEDGKHFPASWQSVPEAKTDAPLIPADAGGLSVTQHCVAQVRTQAPGEGPHHTRVCPCPGHGDTSHTSCDTCDAWSWTRLACSWPSLSVPPCSCWGCTSLGLGSETSSLQTQITGENPANGNGGELPWPAEVYQEKLC